MAHYDSLLAVLGNECVGYEVTELVVNENDLGAAVLEDIGNFVCGEAVVDGCNDSASSQNPVVCIYSRRDVI